MADQVLFDFLTQLARKEGAYVVEPVAAYSESDSYLQSLLGRLRNLPARITSPDPKRPYRFAERGERGRWLFVWVPYDR